jgi:hypothetical protein
MTVLRLAGKIVDDQVASCLKWCARLWFVPFSRVATRNACERCMIQELLALYRVQGDSRKLVDRIIEELRGVDDAILTTAWELLILVPVANFFVARSGIGSTLDQTKRLGCSVILLLEGLSRRPGPIRTGDIVNALDRADVVDLINAAVRAQFEQPALN